MYCLVQFIEQRGKDAHNRMFLQLWAVFIFYALLVFAQRASEAPPDPGYAQIDLNETKRSTGSPFNLSIYDIQTIPSFRSAVSNDVRLMSSSDSIELVRMKNFLKYLIKSSDGRSMAQFYETKNQDETRIISCSWCAKESITVFPRVLENLRARHYPNTTIDDLITLGQYSAHYYQYVSASEVKAVTSRLPIMSSLVVRVTNFSPQFIESLRVGRKYSLEEMVSNGYYPRLMAASRSFLIQQGSWRKQNPYILIIQAKRARCFSVLLCLTEDYYHYAGQDECLLDDGQFEFLGQTVVHAPFLPFWRRRKVFYFKQH